MITKHRRTFGHALAARWVVVVLTLGICTPGFAQSWSLEDDFSIAANPNGAWSYGSMTSTNPLLTLYTDVNAIPPHYNTQQLEGWTDPTFPVTPFVLKNVSNQDWV